MNKTIKKFNYKNDSIDWNSIDSKGAKESAVFYTFTSRAKCMAYMKRFTTTAKRLGFIPHYSIAPNSRSIVITLTARPSDVKPCANAMRPLCKDNIDLIDSVHQCCYDLGSNLKTVIHGINGFNMYHCKPRAYYTPYSRLIISHLV